MVTNTKKYNKEHYEEYWGNPTAIKDRSDRNKARKEIGLKKGDPREVDHKNTNPQDNKKSNLRAISRKTNRTLGAAKANKNRYGK